MHLNMATTDNVADTTIPFLLDHTVKNVIEVTVCA